MRFYSSIAAYYEDIFPLKSGKINFVLENAEQPQCILDIGCSTGELSTVINQQGHKVYGIDLDEAMIEKAKLNENEDLHFQVMNMLNIDEHFDAGQFDQILCFGNTIVHLQDREQVFALFKKVRLLLKEPGMFKFQIINYDKVIHDQLEGLPTIENDKIKFVRKYKIMDDDSLEFQTDLLVKNENLRFKNTIRLITLRKDEIIDLLKKAGFSTISFYSSFSKTPYSEANLPLVFEAR